MKRNSITLDQVNESIYRLLDGFDRFGHLYGHDGMLKDRYRHLVFITDDAGRDVLCDEYGNRVEACPFADYNLNCDYQDRGEAIMPVEEDYFIYDYRFLNLHNGISNEFKDLTREDVIKMSSDEIVKDYLPDWLTDQLIAMLRCGRNYAAVSPVPFTYGDSFLKEQIIFTWKSILIGTIDAREIAGETTFHALEYADLFKDIAKEKKVASFRDSDSLFGSIESKVALPYGGSLAYERLEKYREANRSRNGKLADVISLGRDPDDIWTLNNDQDNKRNRED